MVFYKCMRPFVIFTIAAGRLIVMTGPTRQLASPLRFGQPIFFDTFVFCRSVR